MKIRDFMPELPSMLEQQQGQMTNLLNNMVALNKYGDNGGITTKGSERYRAPSLGLEVIYGTWIGQEFAFRQHQVTQILEFAKNVEEVRAPVHIIINEVFRKGIQWKAKFACKCETCGTEYLDEVDFCDVCDPEADGDKDDNDGVPSTVPPPSNMPGMGSGDSPNFDNGTTAPGTNSDILNKQLAPLPVNPMQSSLPNNDVGGEEENKKEKKLKGKLRKPKEEEKKKIKPFMDDCNIWNQSVEEVLRAIWFDINTIDDCFLYIAKEYLHTGEKNDIRSKPIEIRRLNPGYVEWDLDMNGLPKTSHFMCYIHREEVLSETAGECPECGNDLIPAMFKYHYHGEVKYYFESEIIHESKFMPTETYGYSPILTLLSKILTIRGMDLFLYRYFFERRTPASMVLVSTDDAEGLRRERERMAAETRKDPTYVPLVAVSAKTGRGRVDMVRLFHTLQEMDYLPVREEIRERIAAMWGVTPIWQSVTDVSGGMAGQAPQLIVMSRVVEGDQRIIMEKIFPKILTAFGIEDWVWELPTPEEKAEATRIAFAQQRLSAANMALQMGFNVEIKSKEVGLDDIDFIISGEAMNPQQQMGGGGMPPMGGGMPPMSGGEPPAGGMPLDNPPPPPDQGGGMGGGQPQEMQKMLSNSQGFAKNIIEQLGILGFNNPILKSVGNNADYIIFDSFGSGLYKADIDFGRVIKIEKYVSAKMHRHEGAWTYHNMDIKHRLAGQKPRNDMAMFEPEEPDIVTGEDIMDDEMYKV